MGVLLHWATRGPGRCEQTAAYEATLPTFDELSCGVLMSDDETTQLQHDALAKKCEEARQRAVAVAEEVRLTLSIPPGGLSDDDMRLALARASSRTFGAMDGALGLMVPAADMMNHRFGPSCNFRVNAAETHFELYTMTSTSEGDELFITYGEDLTNAELMMSYGFSVPCNPNETLAFVDNIGMGTAEKTTTTAAASEYDRFSGGGGGGGGVGLGGAAVDAAALGAAATAVAGLDDDARARAVGDALLRSIDDEEQARSYANAARRALSRSAVSLRSGGGGGGGAGDTVMTKDDRRRGVMLAAEACESALSTLFSTTLEEDENLLRGGSCTARVDAAVRYRAERKKLLIASLALLRRAAV